MVDRSRQFDVTSRRAFCGAALAAAVAIPLAKVFAGVGQGKSGVKFFERLSTGAHRGQGESAAGAGVRRQVWV